VRWKRRQQPLMQKHYLMLGSAKFLNLTTQHHRKKGGSSRLSC